MNQPLTVTLARRAGGRVTAIALGAAFATLLAMPLLHLLPADSALHLSAYSLTLTGKILCYAIVALALDLVWGYAGLLSLGHGLFFALGGYAMGMYLMRQIGARGVYANPDLPDFMVFLNWHELPWYWQGFDMFWFAAIMVVLVPGLLVLICGVHWLCCCGAMCVGCGERRVEVGERSGDLRRHRLTVGVGVRERVKRKINCEMFCGLAVVVTVVMWLR